MITVVGIGADGWIGLGDPARRALREAHTILGAVRQLDLLPGDLPGERRAWPSPLAPLLDDLAAGTLGDVTVLASGDPMLHGIGGSLMRRADACAVHVIPHPSSFALACARLGWPQEDVELVSLVARPPEAIGTSLQRGRRGGRAGHRQRRGGRCRPRPGRARLRRQPVERIADPLHVVAFTVGGGPSHPRTPGLADDAYNNDGQLTKRHVRALTVAALAPHPGERLWDVGAGSGSIGIEWLRAERMATAISIEPDADRAAGIAGNALVLGVPHLQVITGRAPAALHGLREPDAVFVGGGITTDGLLETCWDALRPNGRLVVNTVTLEGEQLVAAARARWGGTLVRIDLAHADAVGRYTAWRAALPVVQFTTMKDR